MHALTCKAGGENLWGHTPEQHSTAYEKCASKPVHLPRDYPHKAFLCASGGSSASQELWRGGLSVPQAFPCPHARFARAGSTHSTARHSVWDLPGSTCLAHLPSHSYLPQHPAAETKRRTQLSTVETRLGKVLPGFFENKTIM